MLQQRGAVALPVLTEPFAEVLARHLTYYTLDSPMPHAVIGHPIQNVPDEVLEERAEQLVQSLLPYLPPA